jgi:hypothetical protein
MAWVEGIEEAEGSVVDRESEDRHVVGVHDAMAEADRLPLRQQLCRSPRHRLEQRECRLRGLAARGVVRVDDEVHELLQRPMVLRGVGEVLEVAEADEAGRHARAHRCGLDRLASHRLGRRRDAQRTRRGHAQGMHRLGAEELADRRAQHRAAVAHARVGREAAALQLDLLRSGGGLQLAQPQRAAIAELPGPHAELVAAVDTRQRVHARPHGIAAEHP